MATRRTVLAAAALGAVTAAIPQTSEAAVGRPVIFVSPHCDDETLGFSVMLRRHVTAGRDVHVLLLTNRTITHAQQMLNGTLLSTWWGVLHDPAVEGYAPLDQAAMDAARQREQRTALRCQGITPERIHRADLPEGFGGPPGSQPSQAAVDQAKAAVVALADTLPTGQGQPGLWAPSYLVDDHPDHLAAGKAVVQLGRVDPVRYPDRRYVVLPQYWSDARLQRVPGRSWGVPADADERRRTVNAIRAYGAWQPEVGAMAVGWHSVPSVFRLVADSPKALVHRD
jgi:LmbE family N-acetylglucosaminyl deacetylase